MRVPAPAKLDVACRTGGLSEVFCVSAPVKLKIITRRANRNGLWRRELSRQSQRAGSCGGVLSTFNSLVSNLFGLRRPERFFLRTSAITRGREAYAVQSEFLLRSGAHQPIGASMRSVIERAGS